MPEQLLGIEVATGTVLPEWIDQNGHMNVAYYVLAFDLAIDALWERIGVTEAYIRDTRGSTFAVESHVTYQRELKQAEPYIVTMQLLAYDSKRIHHFQRMYHAEKRELSATAEWMTLHVDLRRRRVSTWAPQILQELENIAAAQTPSEFPAEVGKRMHIDEPIYTLVKGLPR